MGQVTLALSNVAEKHGDALPMVKKLDSRPLTSRDSTLHYDRDEQTGEMCRQHTHPAGCQVPLTKHPQRHRRALDPDSEMKPCARHWNCKANTPLSLAQPPCTQKMAQGVESLPSTWETDNVPGSLPQSGPALAIAAI